MNVRETPCCAMEEPAWTQREVLSVNVLQDMCSATMHLSAKVGGYKHKI